jgi:hypothetical protein
MERNRNDLSKFIEHFPFESDLIIQILKGHLIIEEIMRELLDLQLSSPQSLKGNKGASFDCHQVICLVEAITPEAKNMPWAWDAAKKLNGIRNDLAHQLNPKGLNHKITDLVKVVHKNSPESEIIARELGFPEGNDLFIVILSLGCCFSSLKQVLITKNSA